MEQGLHRDQDCNPRYYLVELLKRKNIEMLQFFHEKLGFDLHARTLCGENLLFESIILRNTECIVFLLNHGLENIPNQKGQTPLDFAKYIATSWPSKESLEIFKMIERSNNFGSCTKRP